MGFKIDHRILFRTWRLFDSRCLEVVWRSAQLGGVNLAVIDAAPPHRARPLGGLRQKGSTAFIWASAVRHTFFTPHTSAPRCHVCGLLIDGRAYSPLILSNLFEALLKLTRRVCTTFLSSFIPHQKHSYARHSLR